ncbi:MAG: ATP-grasp domain-containing protein [Acidimicrobiia bacterium]|nr:ATP-grasp domain-containing protein [Acidimicrobiia bacterium]
MHRLLVANRGEIAQRIFETARVMGLQTVAIYSEPDRDLHVHAADLAVPIGGATASDSYLMIGKVIDAARLSGADAVHPGYGFLAENADFAQTVIDAGLTWVGPPPEAIRSMGLKIQAKETAQEAGLPVLESVVVDGDDPEGWVAQAAAVGYPLMIKASAGGGGKGMRLLYDSGRVTEAVQGARREALSGFGDPTVFFERFLEAPRHVEVQVVADAHGNVVDLFERECSIQRRHQKVVEEAPSPVVTEELRREMGDAAVALARRIGYVGAGTVEFLVADGRFWFLEMNTRLQVEHRVTEEICHLDLVALQLDVAMGRPLPLEDLPEEPDGHAIEVRVYAEDPARGYMPSTGEIVSWGVPYVEDVDHDAAVRTGSVVTPHYDPMLAKVWAWAETREEAAAKLALVLDDLDCCGVTTNAAMLAETLRHDAFVAGETSTDFLDRHPEVLAAGPADVDVRRHAVAAALFAQEVRRATAPVLGFAPSGWRNVRTSPQRVSYTCGSARVDVEYTVGHGGAVDVATTLDGDTEPAPARITSVDVDSGDILIEVGGLASACTIVTSGDTTYVRGWAARSCLVEIPRFVDHAAEAAGGGPTAPLPGTVSVVAVAAGDSVKAGQTLVVLEAMKMEHTITAPADAVVSAVHVGVGDSVDQHAVLVDLEVET